MTTNAKEPAARGQRFLNLAQQVRACDLSNNALDVLIEVALFQPGTAYTAARPNAAGTKVIYTDRAGNEVTFWAEDWTTHRRRKSTIEALINASQQARP